MSIELVICVKYQKTVAVPHRHSKIAAILATGIFNIMLHKHSSEVSYCVIIDSSQAHLPLLIPVVQIVRKTVRAKAIVCEARL